MPRKPKSELQRVTDYQMTFATEHGKRVLHDLMETGHMLHPSYNRGDAMETAFREGERNMVLRIFAILKVKPDQLKARIKEMEESE